jgi:hypothetical protein
VQDFSVAPHAARNTRRDLSPWSDDMTKPRDVAEAPHGYLLPEEGFEKLEQIRNQLFLMASVIFAVTQAEEQEPLEIQRSMLGQCFDSFGLQLNDVLTTMAWVGQSMRPVSRPH